MKHKIIAKSYQHLQSLINNEIELNGNQCDLNHIDVSAVTNMSYLFHKSEFNGNISGWDVSNVVNMNAMFSDSKFNGDISKWNVSKVNDMSYMFNNTNFNKDISNWDVSSVTDMSKMFFNSMFNQDISRWDVSSVTNIWSIFRNSHFSHDVTEWKPYQLEVSKEAFIDTKAPVPYWANYDNPEDTCRAIEKYELNKALQKDLNNGSNTRKKPKI